MTTIVKSNNAYAGANSLTNVSVVTKSAQDLYDEYAARVVADGGIVSDSTECLAAIQDALDHDYYWRTAIAVSPRWGRKVSGANITKLYNLMGSIDGICAGTVALNDGVAVVGEQLAEVQTGDTITFTGVTVLATGADGLAVMSVIYGAAASVGQIAFTPAAEQWLFNGGVGAAQSLLAVNAVTKYTSSPEYAPAALDSTAVMAEMSTLRTSGFLNGLLKKVSTPTGGFTTIAAGATANVVYQRGGGTPYLGELWFFNDMSGLTGQNALMNASQDAGDRF